MPHIPTLPSHLRPREKLASLGAANLKDVELLAILLRTGTQARDVLSLAGDILKKFPLREWDQLEIAKLQSIPGIQLGKACTLLAAVELGRRSLDQAATRPVIHSAKEAYAQFAAIASQHKEHFVVLYLNARHELIVQETISVGTLESSLVHPREVFEPAIRRLASCILLGHNHPSGDLTPSSADRALTKRLIEAGALLGIDVIDHVIVSQRGYSSGRDQGWIS